jgi:hypothetical protein
MQMAGHVVQFLSLQRLRTIEEDETRRRHEQLRQEQKQGDRPDPGSKSCSACSPESCWHE